MKKIFLFLLCLAPSVISAEVSSVAQKADSAYLQKDYDTAIRCYEELLQNQPSAAGYYHLGNAYYRKNDVAHAILNYERALKMAPSDDDIRHNLQHCRAMVGETNGVDDAEMFFVTLIKSLRDRHTASGWACYGYAMLIIALLCLLLSWHISHDMLRKILPSLAILLFGITVFCFAIGAWQHHLQKTDRRAVVLQSCEAKSTSGSAASTVATLPPGSIVELSDDETSSLVRILMPDGTEGWIPQNSYAPIVPQP